MRATRLPGQPILSPESCDRIGSNLNGPSVIEVPDWLPDPLGRFYLYFAHHKGRFIRIAYADDLAGPWCIYRDGVLDVTETPLTHRDISPDVTRYNYAHVASPDVHVDPQTREIRMYYHGLDTDGEQPTLHCRSKDGLTFTDHSAPLGPPYFRVFRHGDWVYAIAFGGQLFRSVAWEGPFERGPNIFETAPFGNTDTRIRHVAVQCNKDCLTLAYSCIGDAPERLYLAQVDLADDWRRWRARVPVELLRPEMAWEGAESSIAVSQEGASAPWDHALRDPFVFNDLIFYCGGGESAIGIARLPQTVP